MNHNIVSIVLFITLLITSKVVSYVIPDQNNVVTKATMSPEEPIDDFSFMKTFKDFERLCTETGGVYDKENGNCNDPRIVDVELKSEIIPKVYEPNIYGVKTIPQEYRDSKWKLNQYPKTLSDPVRICSELGRRYDSYLGQCVDDSPTPTDNGSKPTCAGAWDLCGGIGYEGPTCCPDGFKCVYFTETISKCINVIS